MHVAVTPIRHGTGEGEVKEFKIGDQVDGLEDDQMQALIDAGSVVDLTKRTSAQEEDDETLKRDRLLLASGSLLAGDVRLSDSDSSYEDPELTEDDKETSTTLNSPRTMEAARKKEEDAQDNA